MYKAGNVLSERMIDLNKTDFCDLVERIKDSFMEIDSDIMVDLKKQDIEICARNWERWKAGIRLF